MKVLIVRVVILKEEMIAEAEDVTTVEAVEMTEEAAELVQVQAVVETLVAEGSRYKDKYELLCFILLHKNTLLNKQIF